MREEFIRIKASFTKFKVEVVALNQELFANTDQVIGDCLHQM
jgi:hypothetical protein